MSGFSSHFDGFASKLLRKDFWVGLVNGSTHADSDGSKKFTPEELKLLYQVLDKNPVVNEANRAVVVETIRSIAEFIIWGDQHEPRIFDFLVENNIMVYLHKILQQPQNRRGDVAKQVLQTLSIVVQNIRSETGVFFVFSKNHINNIVETPFDFEDEEVLGFYITFLKAVSLKLSSQTVQFFLNSPEDGGLNAPTQPRLPLYTEAIKFAHHKEGMVRAGVRTLTLSVYSVHDPSITSLLAGKPEIQYFDHIAAYIIDRLQVLEVEVVDAYNNYSGTALSLLDSQLAELEDILSYCSDVLVTAHPSVSSTLSRTLWTRCFVPHVLLPLSRLSGMMASGEQVAKATVVLYALERCFLLLTDPPLLASLAMSVLGLPAPHEGHTLPSCRSALLHILAVGQPITNTVACRMLVAMQRCKTLSPELRALLGLPAPSDKQPQLRPGVLAACWDSLWVEQQPGTSHPAAHTPHFTYLSVFSPPIPPVPPTLMNGHPQHSVGLTDAGPLGGEDLEIAQLVEEVLAGLVEEVCWDEQVLAAHAEQPASPSSSSSSSSSSESVLVDISGIPVPQHVGTDLLDALLTCLVQPGMPQHTLWLVAHLILVIAQQQQQRRVQQEESAAAAAQDGDDDGEGVGAGGPLMCDAGPLQPPNTSFLQPRQWELLLEAFTHAEAVVCDQLDQCWADAFFPVFGAEWGYAAAGVRSPLLSASADQLITGCYMQTADAVTLKDVVGLRQSAMQALQLCHAVQRLVAVLQVYDQLQVVRQEAGEGTLAGLMADLSKAWVDVVNGQQVSLSKANSVPCQVCFQPPDPIRVSIALAGDAAALLMSLAPDKPTKPARSLLLHSSPAVVLAQPASNMVDAGVVLSIAPLLGCRLHVNNIRADWLHVFVRPSVQSLLEQVKRAAQRRGSLASFLTVLDDGHWILQFHGEKRLQVALQLVERTRTGATQAYKDMVHQFLATWLQAISQ